jgi:hypothetical protein
MIRKTLMKKAVIISFLIMASCSNRKEINQVAEISCGQCQFEIKEPMGCDLAIRVDNRTYFIAQGRMPRIKITRKICFKKIVANENNYALAA